MITWWIKIEGKVLTVSQAHINEGRGETNSASNSGEVVIHHVHYDTVNT